MFLAAHLVVLVAVATLAACGGSAKPPMTASPEPAAGSATVPVPVPAAAARAPTDKVQAALASMEQFTSAMCACKDQDCSDKVRAELVRWSEEFLTTAPTDPHVDAASENKMIALTMEITECAQRAAGATPPE